MKVVKRGPAYWWKKVTITYLTLLSGGFVLTFFGYVVILTGHTEWLNTIRPFIVLGILSFFFSSGIASTFASAKKLNHRFLRAAKKGSVLITCATLVIAGLFYVLDGTAQNLKAVGFLYILFVILAWAQILLGLAIGLLCRAKPQEEVGLNA